MWILLGLLLVLLAPLALIFVKDKFGLNSNKFYGDELNKHKRTPKDKAYEKSAHYTNTINHHNQGSSHHQDGGFH